MKIVLFILLIPMICFSQTGIIRGNVSAKDSKEIIMGASIQLVNTQNGVASDKNGNYELKNVPQGKHIILCKFVGAKPIVDTIVVKRNDSVVIKNFFMEPEKGKNLIITEQEKVFVPLKK